jgi:hypothetical protein
MPSTSNPQGIVGNTTKDPARPAHEDADDHVRTAEEGERHRINRIAGEMAGRGLERERKSEEGRDIIVESDPHGGHV